MTTLHLIQDVATPHNLAIIDAFRQGYPDVRLMTWYSVRNWPGLPWKEALAGGPDAAYCDSWSGRLRLLRALVRGRADTSIIVGYSTFAPRCALVMLTCLRRRFAYWSDHPADRRRSWFRRLARALVYGVVRRRASAVLAVGDRAVSFFRDRGFSAQQVRRLPICVAVSTPLTAAEREGVRAAYGVSPHECFVVAASRLERSKGYDLAIEALDLIDRSLLGNLRVLIVGSGPEGPSLERLVRERALQGCVQFAPWMEPAAYQQVIAGADIFLHPARFDAFGGGTLYAMAAGVPVIASDGAGSAVERVIHDENGLMYPSNDFAALAKHIVDLLSRPEERARLGANAHTTAERWNPRVGAEILHGVLGDAGGRVKPALVLRTQAAPRLWLRSAGWEDQERLRAWKNANRRFFFFQGVIDAAAQRAWFERFLRRADDHMFIVEVDGRPIGCMAVRLLEDALDVYNVILGDEGMRGTGTMSTAIRLMCRFAVDRYRRPVRLNVLTDNPAVGWYLRNGFRERGRGENFLVLELERTDHLPPVEITEGAQ